MELVRKRGRGRGRRRGGGGAAESSKDDNDGVQELTAKLETVALVFADADATGGVRLRRSISKARGLCEI